MVAANSFDTSCEDGAAATYGGEVTQGGAGAGGWLPLFVAEEGDCRGSSNPAAVKHSLPLKAVVDDDGVS